MQSMAGEEQADLVGCQLVLFGKLATGKDCRDTGQAQSLTDPLDVDSPDEIQPWHGWDRDRNIAA
jgi:hypothetical protein